ncbi:MAG: hypothetical protein Q8P76_01175 [bacterium]|nr:hypothetical protein [bacterium]
MRSELFPNSEKQPAALESIKSRELREIFDAVGRSFKGLEELAGQVCADERGVLSLAGVEVRQESLSPEKLEKIESLRQRASEVLAKTAKKAFKLTRILALGTLGIAGYAAVDLEKQEGFAFKETAKQELKETGTTSDQKYSAYKPGISELLYRGVEPVGYQDTSTSTGIAPGFFRWLEKRGVPGAAMLQKFLPNLIYGREFRNQKLNEALKKYSAKLDEISKKGLTEDEQDKANEKLLDEIDKEIAPYALFLYQHIIIDRLTLPERDDAWRLYLGLPQLSGTFGISDFRPSISKEDKYYFKLDKYWDDMTRTIGSPKEVVSMLKKQKGLSTSIKGGISNFFSPENESDTTQQVMGTYTLGLGQDESGYFIFYYDKWDLASFWAENPISKGVGRPPELYDRLYYNPETFEIIKNE